MAHSTRKHYHWLYVLSNQSYGHSKFYIAGTGIIDIFFVPVTLTLTRWPSSMNLTRILWRYTWCANMNFLRQGFRKLSYDRQTYKQTVRHGRN